MTIYSRIEFLDKGPDERGRRAYTLYWEDPFGVYRPERGVDGKPVGYRRAQIFRSTRWTEILQQKGILVTEPLKKETEENSTEGRLPTSKSEIFEQYSGPVNPWTTVR